MEVGGNVEVGGAVEVGGNADRDPHDAGDRSASIPTVPIALAERIIEGARSEAKRLGLRLAFAVVDGGGNLVAAARDDGAQLGAMSLAHDKAYTAAAFGMPTSAWVTSSQPGGSDWGLAGTLGGRAIVFPGGVPVLTHGQLAGGVGVSGTASTVDEQCAKAGLRHAGLETAE